jgi:uncharacterized protein (TIGR02118 family)
LRAGSLRQETASKPGRRRREAAYSSAAPQDNRREAMKRITVLYPNYAESWFDIDYYIGKHMPMAIERLSRHPGYRGVTVEHGTCGVYPGTKAAYTVMCHYLFISVDDFMAAYMPHAAVLKGDIPNYTDIEPTIQIGDVLI